MRNYHLFAILLKKVHTEQNMFDSVWDVLLEVAGDLWDQKLYAVTTDGAANMTGRHCGVTRMLLYFCLHKMNRIVV